MGISSEIIRENSLFSEFIWRYQGKSVFLHRKWKIKHSDNIRPPMDAPTTEAHSLQKKEFWRQAVKSGK
jgi:hypothetical protein